MQNEIWSYYDLKGNLIRKNIPIEEIMGIDLHGENPPMKKTTSIYIKPTKIINRYEEHVPQQER